MKNAMLEQWDLNHDGKINRDELTMLLLQQSKVAAELEGIDPDQESDS